MNRLVGGFLVGLVLATGAGAQPDKPRLQRIVKLSAEHGMVAFRSDTVSVFSPGTISLQDGRGGLVEYPDKKNNAVTVRIESGGWKRVAANLDLQSAFDPPLCDPLNQIDVGPQHSEVRAALPSGAKIKDVQMFDGGLLVVVFSTSLLAVEYDVRVALLRTTSPTTAEVLDMDTATEWGNYCGMLVVAKKRFAVLADQPAASSDYLAVYVYDVR